MKIAIASDRGGVHLKTFLYDQLTQQGYTLKDFGCEDAGSTDYSKGFPDYAEIVARKVAAGEFDRGILVCGTGIGMSIAANKVKGIRCALVHDLFSAEQTRLYNDSNVLALGEALIGKTLACEIAKVWLSTEFRGNPNRIAKIAQIENTNDRD